MLSIGDIPAELYRWFLFAYGATSVARVTIEAYKQIVVLNAAWYDVPTLALSVLEYGFVQQALLSLASAEVSNVVLGALMKRKARTEGREQSNREWREWLRRKENAERKGEPFNEPAPDGMPAETLIDSEHPGG